MFFHTLTNSRTRKREIERGQRREQTKTIFLTCFGFVSEPDSSEGDKTKGNENLGEKKGVCRNDKPSRNRSKELKFQLFPLGGMSKEEGEREEREEREIKLFSSSLMPPCSFYIALSFRFHKKKN